MCGQNSLFPPPPVLEQRFDATARARSGHGTPSPPSEDLAVGRDDTPDAIDRLERGLRPGWADDPGDAPRPINARAETAAEKPIFRDAVQERRCPRERCEGDSTRRRRVGVSSAPAASPSDRSGPAPRSSPPASVSRTTSRSPSPAAGSTGRETARRRRRSPSSRRRPAPGASPSTAGRPCCSTPTRRPPGSPPTTRGRCSTPATATTCGRPPTPERSPTPATTPPTASSRSRSTSSPRPTNSASERRPPRPLLNHLEAKVADLSLNRRREYP